MIFALASWNLVIWIHHLSQTAEAEVSVIFGPCQQDGICVTSPNYPAKYGNDQACSLTFGGGATVVEFQTESYYDKLTVGGEDLSGSSLDGHSLGSGKARWTSDDSTTALGWKICDYTGEVSRNLQSDDDDGEGYYYYYYYNDAGGYSGPTLAPSPFPRVISGPCLEDSTYCLTSPNYPQKYRSSQDCELSFVGKVDLVDFKTEAGYDYLTIENTYYSGSRGPPLREVLTGASIFWSSDNSVNAKGWKICTQEILPTLSPTPLPPGFTASPTTPVPTASPTEPCICLSMWVTADEGCEDAQYGCPDVPCDGDEDGSWCELANPGCGTDLGGWAYCIQTPMPSDAPTRPQTALPTAVPTPQPPRTVAVAPTHLEAIEPGATTLRLTWQAGDSNDCIFDTWFVQIRIITTSSWARATGCTGLTSRTITTCTAAGLQTNTPYQFRVMEKCADGSGSQWAVSPSATATLLRPANKIEGVVASNPTPDTLTITWDVPQLNDCAMTRYLVQSKSITEDGQSSEWNIASSCTNLLNVCTSFCTTSGLTSLTTFVFRVKVSCTPSYTSSPWSDPSPSATTLPLPADAPTGLVAVSTNQNGAQVSWQPGPLQDCTFQGWDMQFQAASGSAYWQRESGCTGAAFNAPICHITDLHCDTTYRVRVATECSDAAADSNYSDVSIFRTEIGSGCLIAASGPTSIRVSERGTNFLRLHWEEGVQNDCIFVQWGVYVLAESEAEWQIARGCTNLFERTATTCLASSLESTTRYNIKVREECTIPATNSSWTVSTSLVQTLPYPAERVQDVIASDPTSHSMKVTWEIPQMNDCIFSRYEVEWQESCEDCGQFIAWLPAVGCSNLQNECNSICTAMELPSVANIKFRVRVRCSANETDGAWSVASSSSYTLLKSASAPSSITTPNVSDTEVSITWISRSLGDCTFAEWAVETQIEGEGSSWTKRPECVAADYENPNCTMSRLVCNTNYIVRVAVVCADADANSAYSEVASFRTQNSAQCLWAAFAPISLVASEIQQESLRIDWQPGEPHDCNFARWDVQTRPDNGVVWSSAEGCNQLELRSTLTCHVVGLQSSMLYEIRIREECVNSATNSPWKVSDSFVATLPKPAAAVEGVIASDPTPSSLTVTWDVPQLNDCVFTKYGVEWRAHDDSQSPWHVAPGCSQLTNACITSCTVTGLQPLQAIIFRVRGACVSASTEAAWSVPSEVAHTLPVPAQPPSSVTLLQVSHNTAQVAWAQGPLHDCQFQSWLVEVRVADGGAFWVPQPDCENADFDMPQCKISDLHCSTMYNLRVAIDCVDPAAASGYSDVLQFQTLNTFTCLMAASAPMSVDILDPGITTLRVVWDAGAPHDCTFKQWRVQFQPKASALWEDAVGCIGLQARNTSSCIASALQSNTHYLARVREECNESAADSLWNVSVSSVQTLPKSAEAVQAVFASNPTPSSLTVTWDMPQLNDCVLAQYLVEWHVPADTQPQWLAASGCTTLQNACITACEATGLPAKTGVSFRVKIDCESSATNSEWSIPSLTVSTLPTPADAPSNVNVAATEGNTAQLLWQGQSLHDCIFQHWVVETKIVVQGSSWERRSECESVAYENTSCVIMDLLCKVDYKFRISAACTDSNANSGYSDVTNFRPDSVNCPAAAHAPSNLAATHPTVSTVVLTWQAGKPKDCNFTQWGVELRSENSDMWEAAVGCELGFRSTTTCTASGMQSNTKYKFRVREECDVALAGSPWTTSKTWVMTLSRPADVVEDVAASSPTSTSLIVTWDVPQLHDCVMTRYAVEWRALVDPHVQWFTAMGCESLENVCTSVCTASGLSAQTSISFRVRVVCSLQETNSAWSDASSPVSTFPIPADAPSDVNVNGTVRSTSATFTWVAGLLHQCVFKNWVLEIQIASQVAFWSRVECTFPDFTFPECSASELQCDTEYRVRVATECTDPHASSGFADPLTFKTDHGNDCLVAASAPVSISASGPSMSTMSFSWIPGDAHDCLFKSWSVELRPENSALWHTAAGCTELQVRNQSACVASGLQSNMNYIVRVREMCDITTTDSAWTASSSPVATLPRGADVVLHVIASDPTPTSLTVAWDVPQLHDCVINRYVVEWTIHQEPQSQWMAAAGCATLSNPCMSACIATGLPANTAITFRVRVTCDVESTNNAWSIASEAVDTLPTPADLASNITAKHVFHNSAILSWQGGLLHDCEFVAWNVEIQRLAESSFWLRKAECATASYTDTECELIDLQCETDFRVRIAIECTESTANSGYSQISIFRTLGNDACLLAASGPVSVLASNPSMNTIRLDWVSGEQRDCDFENWVVQMQPASNLLWVDASGCTQLNHRNITTCIVSGLQSNMEHSFRVKENCTITAANSPWTLSKSPMSTLPRPANAVERVSASNPTPSTMTISWDVPQMNDCVMQQYELEWQSSDAKTQWVFAVGCSDLRSECTSVCMAIGLPANTSVVFRIRVSCIDPLTDSEWSAASLPVYTLPTPAEAPTELEAEVSNNSARFRWTAGPLHDCIFKNWALEIQVASQPASWFLVGECADSDYPECSVSDLQCNTEYRIRIAAECTDPQASSSFSLPLPFTTERAGDCSVAAFAPVSASAFAPSISTISILWAPGEANDCIFKAWDVQVQPENSGLWDAAAGCDGLVERNITSCVASGLQSDTKYKVRVREECHIEKTNSAWTVSASVVSTLPKAAETVQGVIASNPTPNSLTVEWDAPQLNDCQIEKYVVEWKAQETSPQLQWTANSGCARLTDACASACTATGLPASTAIIFRVQVSCVVESTNSAWSTESQTVFTLPTPADAPSGMTFNQITHASAHMSWQGGLLHDCTFVAWIVEIRVSVENAFWLRKAECISVFYNETSCDLIDLQCDTEYHVRSAVECAETTANSGYSQTVSFQTLESDDCLFAASGPLSVVATSPSMTTIRLEWVPGESNDCDFMQWAVQAQPMNQAAWMDATGCTDLVLRTSTSCIASGLQSNMEHEFRVREICEIAAANSPWTASASVVATLPRGADRVQGVIASNPTPNSLTVEWDVARLNDCMINRYLVEWKAHESAQESQWVVAPGCEGLKDACISTCIASGLPASTGITFRVRVVCVDESTDSEWSVHSPAMSTLPTPADAPSDIHATVTHSTAQIKWQAEPLRDCRFIAWIVEFQIAVDNSFWIREATCAGSSYNESNCDIFDLQCETGYRVRIAVECAESTANSAYGEVLSFQTLASDDCLLAASGPVSVVASDPTMSTIRLEWAPGQAHDCAFKHWTVQVQPASNLLWVSATGCAQLAPRNITSCIVSGLQSNVEHSFRVKETCNITAANSPWTLSTSPMSTLPRPANAVERISASNPTPNTMIISWDVPQMNDCVMQQYELEWQSSDAKTQWMPALGCSDLRSECTTACMAIGLPANTSLVFRIRASCIDPLTDSEWSDASLPVYTLPTPAEAPTKLEAEVSNNSARFEWSAGPLHDCTFKNWALEIQIASQPASWFLVAECADSENPECYVSELQCDTEYRVRIATECTNPDASSSFSVPMAFRTERAGDCFVAAFAPLSASASAPSISTINVLWTPGEANDCIFKRWNVQVQPENNALWDTPVGCDGLEERNVTTCVASGLQSNMKYSVRVKEECHIEKTNSAWTTSASIIATLPRAAEIVQSVIASNPTPNSLTVEWDAVQLNDCEIDKYIVEWKAHGTLHQSQWFDASGCAKLTNACVSACVAAGLPASTAIVFRVRVACAVESTNSAWSTDSQAVSTLPTPADAPSGIIFSQRTHITVHIKWQASLLHDCTFVAWIVEVQHFVENAFWIRKAECISISYNETACDLIGLQCDTGYRARVAVECAESTANSGYSEIASFQTLQSDDCLVAASGPVSVVASDPSMTTVRLEWVPGESNDCAFLQWSVQVQPANRAYWMDARGCTDLVLRSSTSCVASALQSNMEHAFRVKEDCESAAANSPWTASASVVATLPRGADRVQGVIASNPTPNSLAVEWDVAQLNDCVILKYVVEWKAHESAQLVQWTVASGCEALKDACISACIATGLPASTAITFRVRVACVVESTSSEWSFHSPIMSTLPTPADAPSGLNVSQVTHSAIQLNWQEESLHDCDFMAWIVEVQIAVENSFWVRKVECASLSYNHSKCHLSDLQCETGYRVRVAAECSESSANSAYSEVVDFQTHGSDDCLRAASGPVSVVASNPTMTEVHLRWVPGEARDCNFRLWKVQVQPANRASWTEAAGCTNISSRSNTQCIVSSLQSDTEFAFRVQEACEIDALTSSWTISVSSVTTLARPADPVQDVSASNPSDSSLVVNWDLPQLNDCKMDHYEVEWKTNGDSATQWAASSGCTSLTDACITACTATGLPALTEIIFRVRIACVRSHTRSEWSERSSPVRTLPIPANPPSQLDVLNLTHNSAILTWRSGALQHCTFKAWAVEVRLDAQDSFWLRKLECASVHFSESTCSLVDLQCDASYVVRIAAECIDANANSGYSEATTFSTLTSPFCLTAASPPASVTVSDPAMDHLSVEWLPGVANDCRFVAWIVQLQAENSAFWESSNGCTELQTRSRTYCLLSDLQSNTNYKVRIKEECEVSTTDSDWSQSAFVATLPRPANDIEGVVGFNPTSNSLAVKWEIPSLHDCSLKRYVVEWQAPFDKMPEWKPASGCSKLESPCISECIALGLPALTKVSFRVRARCSVIATENNFSLSSPPLATLPTPAEPSSALEISDIENRRVRLSWQPGPLRDCTFDRWAVEVRGKGEGAIWQRNLECADTLFEDPACNIDDLQCGEAYQVRIKTTCTNPHASSDYGEVVDFKTLEDAECLKAASGPTDVGGSNASMSSILVTWKPGESYDCTFVRWVIELRPDNSASFSPPTHGCRHLTSRSTTDCIASGLQSDTEYQIRVREQCTFTNLHSPWSASLATVATLPKPSRPVENVLGSGPTANSMIVSWDVPLFNDCTFDRYVVEWRTTDRDWSTAVGCTSVKSPCTSTCVALNLPSYTQISFRVRVDCASVETNSPWSGASPAKLTLPIPADTPAGLAVANLEHNSVKFSWQPMIWNDCDYRSWGVETRLAHTSSTWVPSQCQNSTGKNSTTCEVVDLSCNTTYQIRALARCSEPLANSDYSDALMFTTSIGPTCLNRADPPHSIVAANPSFTTLQLSWAAGRMNDCEFKSWYVSLVKAGECYNDCEFVPNGCRNLLTRGLTTCIATDLDENTAYKIRAQVQCIDRSLNSMTTISAAAVSTLLVPTPEVVVHVPADNSVVRQRPYEAMIIYSEPVEIKRSNLSLEICTLSTIGIEERPCKHADPAAFTLLSGSVAKWSLNSSLWRQGHTYRLNLNKSFFVSLQKPEKIVSSTSWEFTYNAIPPVMRKIELNIVNTISLTIAVQWDSNAMFQCRARLEGDVTVANARRLVESANHKAFVGDLVPVQFDDLVPGSAYTVECQAKLQIDQEVISEWLNAGRFVTAEDTNTELSSLQVSAQPICSDGVFRTAETLTLEPPLNPYNLTYDVVLPSFEFDQECMDNKFDGDATWRMVVKPVTSSTFAKLDFRKMDGWKGNLERDGASRQITLPSGQAEMQLMFSFTVTPFADEAAKATYVITVTALRGRFDVGLPSVTYNGKPGGIDNPLQEDGQLSVDVTFKGVRLPDKTWKRLSIFLGPFKQNTNRLALFSVSDQQYRMTVPSIKGVGSELALVIVLDGTVVGTSPRNVSFIAPKMSCVSTLDFQYGEDCIPKVHTVQNTTLYVVGTGFGSHPTLNENVLLRLVVFPEGGDPFEENLCEISEYWTDTMLKCLLMPRAAPPLRMMIYGPHGLDGTVALVQQQVVIEYEKPTVKKVWFEGVGEANSTQLSLQTKGGIIWMEGENFPDFGSDTTAVGLTGSPQSSERGLSLVSGDAERQLGATDVVGLCDEVVRVNHTHIMCKLKPFLDTTQIGCKTVKFTVGWKDLISTVEAEPVTIPPPQILDVIQLPYAVEVGTKLVFQVRGRGFGVKENGLLTVQLGDRIAQYDASSDDDRNDSFISCTVSGALRDNVQELYPKVWDFNSSSHDVYLSIPVKVTLGGGSSTDDDDCAPISAHFSGHRVRLVECDPGKRRDGVESDSCMDCEHGKFQPYTGAFLSCDDCPQSFYQDELGKTACKSCPRSQSTETVGSREADSCRCIAGHYLAREFRENGQYFEDCIPCPRGAFCAGALEPPRATQGYWFDVDTEICTPCTLNGCLGNNTCRVGYAIAMKCDMCSESYYTDKINETCEKCSKWIWLVTAVYFSIVGSLFIFIVVPMVAWKARVELDVHAKDQEPWICCGACKGRNRIWNMLLGIAFGLNEAVILKEHMPWPRARKVFACFTCIGRSRLQHLLRGAEFQRVLILCLSNLQVLYIVGNIGYQYWPETAKQIMKWGSYLMNDIEELQPECFIGLEPPKRWLCVWILPYILFAIFGVAIRLNGARAEMQRPAIMMVCGGTILYLMRPHLSSSFSVLDCRGTGDGAGTMVLEIDRTVTCWKFWGLSDDPDITWSWMFTLVLIEYFAIVMLMAFIGRTICSSYFWYRYTEVGSPPPWSVYLSWWWVTGCNGLSVKHRAAIRGQRMQLSVPTRGLSAAQVGAVCQDLFVSNMGELRGKVCLLQKQIGNSSHACQSLSAREEQLSSRVSTRSVNLWQKNKVWQTPFAKKLADHVPSNAKDMEEFIAEPAVCRARRLLRMRAYNTLSRKLADMFQQLQMMSSFSHQNVNILNVIAYMWELVSLTNAIALSLVRIFTTHFPKTGIRIATVWMFLYVVLLVAVRPYRHPGLNIVDTFLNVCLFLAFMMVLSLETWADYPNKEQEITYNLLQFLNLVLIFMLLLGCFSTLCLWLFYYLWSLVFKETHYVMNTLPADTTLQTTNPSDRAQVQQELMKAKKWETPIVTVTATCAGDLPSFSNHDRLSTQWLFNIPPHGDKEEFVMRPGCMLVIRNEKVLHHLLQAKGQIFDTANASNPVEIRELNGLGDLCLARGGDLDGIITVFLPASPQASQAELVCMKQENPDFKIKSPKIIGGRSVPKGSMLISVRFCTPGNEPDLVQRVAPDDFIIMAEGRLEEISGLLVLEFMRPKSAEDLHRELCELIIMRSRSSPSCRFLTSSALSFALFAEGSNAETATTGLDLDEITAAANAANFANVLPVDIRVQSQHTDTQLMVHRHPMWGCLDEVLVMTRKGQQWLVQERALEQYLGLTHAAVRATLTKNAVDKSEEIALAGKCDVCGHYEGFIARSAWRTSDGGIVMIHNGICFGGAISAKRAEESALVEGGQILGMAVTWRPSPEDSPMYGWYDGTYLHWHDDADEIELAHFRGISYNDNITRQLSEQMQTKQDHFMRLREKRNGNGSSHKQQAVRDLLPRGPWSRIRHSVEEGGIPGPDGGLWTLDSSFYAECHGVQDDKTFETLLQHQAGDGSTDMYERTRNDAKMLQKENEKGFRFSASSDEFTSCHVQTEEFRHTEDQITSSRPQPEDSNEPPATCRPPCLNSSQVLAPSKWRMASLTRQSGDNCSEASTIRDLDLWMRRLEETSSSQETKPQTPKLSPRPHSTPSALPSLPRNSDPRPLSTVPVSRRSPPHLTVVSRV